MGLFPFLYIPEMPDQSGATPLSFPFIAHGSWDDIIAWIGTNGGQSSYSNPIPSQIEISEYLISSNAYQGSNSDNTRLANRELQFSYSLSNLKYYAINFGDRKVNPEIFSIYYNPNFRVFSVYGGDNSSLSSAVLLGELSGLSGTTWYNISLSSNDFYQYIMFAASGTVYPAEIKIYGELLE